MNTVGFYYQIFFYIGLNYHIVWFRYDFLVFNLQSYFPRATYDDDDEVDNEVLSEVIGNAFVTDAITVYELMQKKGIGKFVLFCVFIS